MGLEMCINDKCMGQDTVIVLLYAVFCVVFGFVTALLVMLADKMKGDREQSGQQSEQVSAEVRNRNQGNVLHYVTLQLVEWNKRR